MNPNAKIERFEALGVYAQKLNHNKEHILECAEVYGNCGMAKKKLLGNELTAELFDFLNTKDEGETCGGIDSMLGRVVIPSQDPSENRELKAEILGLIEKNFDAAVKEMNAALECYCEDLVNAVSEYDAYAEENGAARDKIIDGLKKLSDDDKQKFFDTKFDFNLMQCNNIRAALDSVAKYVEFLSSDQMNLGIIKDIAKKNSGEMSDEDKQFLKELDEAYSSYRETNRSNVMWNALDDSFLNATLTATGYDAKSLVEVIKEAAKIEKKYVSTVRKFKEALLRDTDTEQEVMTKNSEFWGAISNVMCFSYSVVRFFRELNKQVSLLSKALEGVVASATPPENTDDNQQQDDNQQAVDNHEPNHDDNSGEDNNQDDNSGAEA